MVTWHCSSSLCLIIKTLFVYCFTAVCRCATLFHCSFIHAIYGMGFFFSADKSSLPKNPCKFLNCEFFWLICWAGESKERGGKKKRYYIVCWLCMWSWPVKHRLHTVIKTGQKPHLKSTQTLKPAHVNVNFPIGWPTYSRFHEKNK